MADAGAPRDGASYRIERIILAKRARNVAVWAIAFFVAAVPVAIVGGGLERDAGGALGAGGVLAMLFWLLGVLAGGWSFVLGYRHWDDLPPGTRWLASLPLLVVLFLIAASLLAAAIVGPPGGTVR